MKKILINYNFKPDKDFLGDDYQIYDRSDSKEFLKDLPQEKITYGDNEGQVDYPKLMYLVENYDTLPDVFLWGKTNLFKYITPEEYDKVKDNKEFTPLLTKDHKTYSDKFGVVNYYDRGWYWERNDSWYFNSFNSRYVKSFHEWAAEFGIPSPTYIPFAPGGNYILTREVVHRFSRDVYQKMADSLPYCQEPAEAQCAERSYGIMWGNLL